MESENLIRIILNDNEISFERDGTVDALLKQLEIEQVERIAVAVNDSVISRTNWSSYRLNDNDRVLMIAPIQGG